MNDDRSARRERFIDELVGAITRNAEEEGRRVTDGRARDLAHSFWSGLVAGIDQGLTALVLDDSRLIPPDVLRDGLLDALGTTHFEASQQGVQLGAPIIKIDDGTP